jgi:hypothetical protein
MWSLEMKERVNVVPVNYWLLGYLATVFQLQSLQEYNQMIYKD